jgi:hypothetical protein
MGPALGREQKSSKKRELWKSALHHQLSGTYRQKIGSTRMLALLETPSKS